MTKARDISSLIGSSGQIENDKITLDANEIPNLDTAKITTGTFADARLPSTALNSNVDLTNLSASNLTSGTLPDDRFPATLQAISGANLTGISSGGIVASSYSSSGYARFSDGLVIQWGSSSSNSYATFPLTFPNNCFSVVNMIEGTGFWDSENLQGGSIGTSGYQNKMQNKNRSVRYIAIGN